MTELLWGMWQYILTFNISIFDVLDVAIIAYIVYRVLMLVQRTKDLLFESYLFVSHDFLG